MARMSSVLAVAMLLTGCATGAAPQAVEAVADPARYGLEKSQPVEVCMPDGQQRYLAALVCAAGEHPRFTRTGNVGSRDEPPAGASKRSVEAAMERQIMGQQTPRKGEPDYHFVDAYELTCGGATTTVYMDMYHCADPSPTRAPAGFTLTR